MERKPADPWRYADDSGYLTDEGTIRIYGFDAFPPNP